MNSRHGEAPKSVELWFRSFINEWATAKDSSKPYRIHIARQVLQEIVKIPGSAIMTQRQAANVATLVTEAADLATLEEIGEPSRSLTMWIAVQTLTMRIVQTLQLQREQEGAFKVRK